MHKSSPHKSGDFDKYSDYSDDKYDYDEEDDYEDDPSQYQSKGSASPSQARGRHVKDQMKRGSMRGMKQQQCMDKPFSSDTVYVGWFSEGRAECQT